ncbi:MAG: YitT family protein [Clostridiales bacterium]|nr:YitT family protein [Clostridiales bacterium]
MKRKILEEIRGYIGMLVGCLLYGLSTSLFLAPTEIVAGGASGLAVLINLLYNKISVGTLLLLINLPIMLLGLKYQGWKFILRCLLTVATLSVITDLLALLPAPTEDSVLASLYGGICQGVGIGMFVKYQFSSGGTELLGRVLAKFIKGLSIPVCVGILDGAIVIFGAIVTQNPANMLHALIVIFVSTKVSEMILVGFDKSKLCIIISDKGAEISAALLENSPRGVTMLEGQGMYTHNERNVLLTCVKNHQLTQLKQIVKSVDEKAFIIINESVEVRGQGFKALGQDEND